MIDMESLQNDGPMFDGTNNLVWKNGMTTYMICIGDEYWDISEEPYDIPNGLSNATTNQMKQLKKKHDRKLIFD